MIQISVRPRVSGDPGQHVFDVVFSSWIPACAGMSGMGMERK